MAVGCCAVNAFAEDTALVYDNVVDVWGADADAGVGYDLTNVGGGRYARIVDAGAATGDITIPGFVSFDEQQYRVTAIVEGAFTDCVGLKSVTLPKFEGFTVVKLNGEPDILNGIFVNCDRTVKIYYYTEMPAVSVYLAATSDNVSSYMMDIDPDITEDIYSYIIKIFKAVLNWFRQLLGLA